MALDHNEQGVVHRAVGALAVAEAALTDLYLSRDRVGLDDDDDRQFLGKFTDDVRYAREYITHHAADVGADAEIAGDSS